VLNKDLAVNTSISERNGSVGDLTFNHWACNM